MSNFRKYGMIVVGGGITGLSSGFIWAIYHDVKEEPVLIIEKKLLQVLMNLVEKLQILEKLEKF